MKEWLKIISVVLIAAVMFTCGCINSDSVTAAEIKAEVLRSTENIESCKFSIAISMTTTVPSTMTGDGEELTMEGTITGQGTADHINKRLMMEQQVESSSDPSQESIETTIMIYIIDDLLYTKNESQGFVQWLKKNVTATMWSSYLQMEMQAELIEVSEVERLNDEVVNGVDCYVLKIIPDLEKYYEIMMNQQGLDPSNNVLNMDFSELIEGWVVKQWIAKDTHFLMKAYNQMTMNMFGMSSTYETEIICSDYNIPVAIELPAEAENAEWMTEDSLPSYL